MSHVFYHNFKIHLMFLISPLSESPCQQPIIELNPKAVWFKQDLNQLNQTCGFVKKTIIKLSFGSCCCCCCCCLVVKISLTLSNSMDCIKPGSSVHGISQARVLEWLAISFSRRSSWPRDQTHVSCTGRQILCCWGTREAPLGAVACYILSPPFRAFPASFQGLNFESKDRNRKMRMKDHRPRKLASRNGFVSSCRVTWASVFQKVRNFPKSTLYSIVHSESRSVTSDSLTPHGLYSLWNSPGQNTGVGSLSLLQGSSQPRNQTQVSHIAGRFFTSWATREVQK